MLVRHRTLAPTFDRSFDRAFEQLTNSFFDAGRASGPVVDGAWNDDEYVLTVDLPGVPAEAVTVEVTGTTLHLGANTDSLDWNQSIQIGERLDPDKVSARHVDGRLTVRIGTVDQPETRRVPIDTTAPDLAIEATADAGDAAESEAQPTETNTTS